MRIQRMAGLAIAAAGVCVALASCEGEGAATEGSPPAQSVNEELRLSISRTLVGDMAAALQLRHYYCVQERNAAECQKWTEHLYEHEAQHREAIARLAAWADECRLGNRGDDAVAAYKGAMALALQLRRGPTIEVRDLAVQIATYLWDSGLRAEAMQYADGSVRIEEELMKYDPSVAPIASKLVSRFRQE